MKETGVHPCSPLSGSTITSSLYVLPTCLSILPHPSILAPPPGDAKPEEDEDEEEEVCSISSTEQQQQQQQETLLPPQLIGCL